MSQPWERQQYDTDESWLAFVAYRDSFPRRAIRVMVNQRMIDPIKVATWVKDHFWNERAQAYDRHLDDIRRQSVEAAHAQKTREVIAEHMEMLADARQIAMIELKKWLDKAKQGGFETMKPSELTRLIDMIVKNDRLIRDMSTEKHDMSGRLDLSSASDAELADIEARLAALTTNGAEPSSD